MAAISILTPMSIGLECCSLSPWSLLKSSPEATASADGRTSQRGTQLTIKMLLWFSRSMKAENVADVVLQ